MLTIVLVIIILFLLKVLHDSDTCKEKVQFIIQLTELNQKIKTGENVMVEMEIMQEVVLTINPLTRRGEPAEVESIQWTSSDPEILEVTPNPENPKECRVRSLSALGTAQVDVTADADLNPEIEVTISDFVGFEIRQSQAVNLGISATTPVDY